MPGFSVTPVGPFPPVNPEDFPDFLQWQWEGEDIGSTAVDTVNLVGAVSVTIGTGENENVLTIDVGDTTLSWREAAGDTTLLAADAGNGIVTTGTTGGQNIVITGDDIEVGQMVLIYQEGAAGVDIAVASGLNLRVRDGLLPESAGQYATLTIIRRSTTDYILCGDLGL
jgi:hypothetical protein